MIRRVLVSSVKGLKPVGALQVARPLARAMSSTLNEKERGAEAAFIKAQESKRLAEAKAKFDELMKAGDSEEKQDLLELLGTCGGFSLCDRFFSRNYFSLLTLPLFP